MRELLPLRGLPATREPANVELEWFDMDSRDRYEMNRGHPRYGEHDILYRFNSLGYRCPEFDQTRDLRIVAIGCSYVFGVGLPEEDVFHRRFAAKLEHHTGASVVVWNLGSPGASNDYINRITQLAVPFLDPHIVLVNFTHASRREYGSLQNEVVRYNPGWCPSDLVHREIKGHFDALSSGLDDGLNLFRSYRGVASLMSGRRWLFSTSDPECLGLLGDHIDATRYAGVLAGSDTARDHAHPGPESHAALAERYWARYLALESAQPSEAGVPAALEPPSTSAIGLAPNAVPGAPGSGRSGLGAKVRSLLEYLDYRLHRRSRIKKAKERDPNVYPLW